MVQEFVPEYCVNGVIVDGDGNIKNTDTRRSKIASLRAELEAEEKALELKVKTEGSFLSPLDDLKAKAVALGMDASENLSRAELEAFIADPPRPEDVSVVAVDPHSLSYTELKAAVKAKSIAFPDDKPNPPKEWLLDQLKAKE